MICYAFALKDEASGFLSRCTDQESFQIHHLKCTFATYDERRVLVTLIGMGKVNAETNTRTLLEYFRPKVIILSGYGGALIQQLELAHVVISENFTSEEILPFIRLMNGFDFAKFCTTDEVIDNPEKKEALARSTQTQVVDMETEIVARLVHKLDIPFLAIRSISDEYHDILPAGALSAAFDMSRSQVTPLRLLLYLSKNPGQIRNFRRFVRGLPLARQTLTNFLEQVTNELPSHW